MNCTPINECVACGSHELSIFFDLDRQPLANSYKHSPHDGEMYYPLAVNSCKKCGHIQLTHAVNPEYLFTDYAYMSGVSKTGIEFFEWFADMSLQKFVKEPTSVLDVGCNDGSQLDVYKRKGLTTYGVDPARNLYELTRHNHNIKCDFFKSNPFDTKFDLVVVQNAFAHNNNQLEFLKSLRDSLTNDGLLFVTTSQASMIFNGEFDTFYHEHISFYNTNSMKQLCERAGMDLCDVIDHHIHGGSYIFVIKKKNSTLNSINSSVETRISTEDKLGVYNGSLLNQFQVKATKAASQLNNFVDVMYSMNVPVVGYSAPAKGQTFLNFAKTNIDFVIDDTPLKQGKYTPGRSIPIVSSDAFNVIAGVDTAFVIFAWNFYDEIVKKIKQKRPNNNDYFVRYFPEFKVEK